MKKVFLVFGIAFMILYLIAEFTVDKPLDNRVHLRWATDPNPARKVQTQLFGKLNPKIRVSVESGAMEKLIVQCATGTGPDIIDVFDVIQMSGYVQAGILMDLTPYAKEMGFDPSKTYPRLKNALTIEGKQYRFPCNVWANCVVYNKKVFDDHGVAYPKEGWTYEDFIETAKKFNEPGKDGKTYIPLSNWNNGWLFMDIFFNLGGKFYSEDGLESRLDSPEAIKAMQIYHDLMFVHKVIPTPEAVSSMSSQGGWGTGGISWFSTSKAAMMILGRWYLNILVNYPKTAKHVAAVHLPRFEGQPSTGMLGTRAAGISAKSSHKKEAMKFLQYLAGSDYGKLIVKDGDALPPNPTLARTGKDLVNKTVPDPAFHQPFITAIKNARPIDISQFIDALLVRTWLIERIERVENNKGIDVEKLMKGLAKEINLRIKRNIKRNKYLQEKYNK